MNRHLLDVNVLIALIDPNHEFHLRAHNWFTEFAGDTWLTCPITENGAIRVTCHRAYSSPTTVEDAVESIRVLREQGNHEFVADHLSMTDRTYFDPGSIGSTNRLTDAYLVALAASHDASLVTLDQRIVSHGVIAPNHVIHYVGGTGPT